MDVEVIPTRPRVYYVLIITNGIYKVVSKWLQRPGLVVPARKDRSASAEAVGCWPALERERCQVGLTDASWHSHSCGNTAREGLRWPSFWANSASFSLGVGGLGCAFHEEGALGEEGVRGGPAAVPGGCRSHPLEGSGLD